MKPIVLDTETKKAQIVMSAAVTTTAPDFTCSYLDTNGTLFNEGNQNGVLDGTTAVDVVDSPASTYRRIVSEITVYNADSVAVTITLILNDGGVSRIIEKIDLDPSQSYKLTDGQIGTKGAKGDMGDTPAFPAHVRLSLASGDPNPLTDLSAQTKIYAMQYDGDTVPIWSGTAFSAREFADNLEAALHASYQTVGNIKPHYTPAIRQLVTFTTYICLTTAGLYALVLGLRGHLRPHAGLVQAQRKSRPLPVLE